MHQRSSECMSAVRAQDSIGAEASATEKHERPASSNAAEEFAAASTNSRPNAAHHAYTGGYLERVSLAGSTVGCSTVAQRLRWI
jgi:hypothetical protein